MPHYVQVHQVEVIDAAPHRMNHYPVEIAVVVIPFAVVTASFWAVPPLDCRYWYYHALILSRLAPAGGNGLVTTLHPPVDRLSTMAVRFRGVRCERRALVPASRSTNSSNRILSCISTVVGRL